MDNMYQPGTDGGYPADATLSSPHPSPPYPHPSPTYPDPAPAGPRPRTRWFRWAAGLAAGFLVGGGITLAVVSGGSTAAASSAASTATGARAAQLNTALTDAAGASAVPKARVRWALGRIRHLGGVEGNVTFRNKKGFHTLSFERGTIQSVTGSDVVIKSPDGTTWTWKIVSDTVVRKNGGKTTASALTAGEQAFAGGPVVSGARDARLIIVRPASTGSGTSGSVSTSASLS
jgi:hypothetical protein